ncbi:MAG: hypothetical protein HFG72_10005 [Hungatella sp.]|nr:hypothetical protein [Hungatella sp.]
MTRKEQRIMDIMTERHTDQDVAEQLFMDELMERYPDLAEKNLDVAETLYELGNG